MTVRINNCRYIERLFNATLYFYRINPRLNKLIEMLKHIEVF